MALKKGISAIIGTYKGEEYIEELLNSLKNQTINPALFEAIFIINGEEDSTPEILSNFKNKNPKLNIIITYSEKGICNARNKGIELAKKEYLIFIDDDDYLSPKYFEKILEHAKPNRIVLGTQYEIDYETKEFIESRLTNSLLESSGIIEDAYTKLTEALVITTNKLIPTKDVKKSEFNPLVKNGVDISYYANFYPEHDYEFYVMDKNEEANYYYVFRKGSISRKSISYDFNITDRLNVITEINKGLKKAKTPEMASFIKSLTGGQVNKINEYLNAHPEDFKKVCHEIYKRNYDFFPYKYFNENSENLDKPNNELLIAYSFPPSSTTTGNAICKRVLDNKKNIDVIYASLNNLNKDFELEKIVSEFLIRKITIDLDFSTEWKNILDFSKKGIEKLEEIPEYEKIYSVCYFPHSHFLALEYKLKHPDTQWTAEFSDPIIYNFDKNENSSPISDIEYINRINKHIPKELKKIKETDSINFICEYLTYIFADKIVFTNENQKEVMKNLFHYDKIKDIIESKSEIKEYPTLDKKYYYIKESDYELNEEYINFGYFGVIFGNRSLEDYINGFDCLDEEVKSKIRLHIFSPNKTMFEQLLPKELLDKTTLNPNISFLEFLNLTTKLDVLLVNDSETETIFKINPFLPSKFGDYLGSGKKIWAVCEKNSTMDQKDIKYKSRMYDIYSIVNTLNQLLEIENNNRLFKDKDYHIDFDKIDSVDDLKYIVDKDQKIKRYLRSRNTQLIKKIDELIQVAEEEFRKDSQYEKEIEELTSSINQLKEENESIKNSNSWKITKPLRNITNKFK